jgi:hypothetical protein
MEEKERDDIVSIFRQAQSIVEDGIGVIGSSLVKDQLTVNLAGILLSRYWSEKGRPPCPYDFYKKYDPASELAFRLLGEARLASITEAKRPEWIWQTYLYFLKRARQEQTGGGRMPKVDYQA